MRQLAFERNEIPISLGICNTSLYVPFISFSLIEKLLREELKIINANGDTLGCKKIDDNELTMNRVRFAVTDQIMKLFERWKMNLLLSV